MLVPNTEINTTSTLQIFSSKNHDIPSKQIPKSKNTDIIFLENRNFGNNLTNISLTAFEKESNLPKNTLVKAINLIKCTKKHKERSREKNLKISNKNEKKNSFQNSNKNRIIKKNSIVDYSRRNSLLITNTNETFTLQGSNDNYFSNICNLNDNKENKNNNLQKKNSNETKSNEEIKKKLFDTKITIKTEKQNNNLSLSDNKSFYDRNNLQYVTEYQNEIFDYLLSLENYPKINPNYMFLQKDLSEKMRQILIDWLSEVHLKFKLLPETFFLTINFIDRFLNKVQIPRTELQLVAVSSLLIACKYEEIYPPEISSFVYITDNAYNQEQILNMEIKILEALDYDLTYPTQYRYLELIGVKLNLEEKNLFKIQFLLEMMSTKLSLYKYTNLEIVIACCFINFEENEEMKEKILMDLGFGDNKDVKEKVKNCFVEMMKHLNYIGANKYLKGIKKKFSSEQFMFVGRDEFKKYLDDRENISRYYL